MFLRRYFQNKLDTKIARGIIIIDKESGITSHDEVNRLRYFFKTRKVGHSGTLDQKVTGVLVCGLGRGTKVLEYILLSEKIYDCEIVFHATVNLWDFETVMAQFIGTIVQLPPVKSRVKRVARERDIYRLELLGFASDGRTAHIRCAVERGTYIRKLCHDMGEQLGCGAHMGHLRRIQAGPFFSHDPRIVTTRQLQGMFNFSKDRWFGWWYLWRLGRYIIPIESVMTSIPRVVVDPRLRGPLQSGSDVFVPGILSHDKYHVGDVVQVVDTRGILLAIGIAWYSSHELIDINKGIAVRTTKVLV